MVSYSLTLSDSDTGLLPLAPILGGGRMLTQLLHLPKLSEFICHRHNKLIEDVQKYKAKNGQKKLQLGGQYSIVIYLSCFAKNAEFEMAIQILHS